MKNLFWSLPLCLLLLSCATSTKTYLASGAEGHSINCSGTALSWGNCYTKAGEICGSRGYDVVNKSDERGSAVVANQYGLYGGSTMTRSMLIKCK